MITAGFMVAEYVPGHLSDVYVETVGPFLGGMWISLVFRGWWRRNQEQVLSLPAAQQYVILGFAGTLLLLGGVRLLWVDPFLFGPMMWPLVEIAWTLWRRSQPASSP